MQVRRELVCDTEPVTAVAVSPDDETVVVASRSRLLRLFAWTTGVVRRSFKVCAGVGVDVDLDVGVCVCACVCACVRARARVCVCVCHGS